MSHKVLVFIGTFLLVLLFAGIASADNIVPPHNFQGNVLVNGHPAPDGVLITAKLGIKDIAGTTTKDGKYGYEPLLFVPQQAGEDIENGDIVDFYVDGVKAASHAFEDGNLTVLHLGVEKHPFCGDTIVEAGEDCNTCPADAGACQPPGGGGPGDTTPSGGGPGPGGGGPGPSCTEEWICTDWFECFNGKQVRVCADDNRCGTVRNKPPEVQNCTVAPSAPGEACNIGEVRCEGSNVLSCSPAGEFIIVESCQFGCTEGRCNSNPNPEGTGGQQGNVTQSNPILDFFNSLFAGLFGGTTGAAVGGEGGLLWSLFGLLILIIIIILLLMAWKFRNGKKKKESKK